MIKLATMLCEEVRYELTTGSLTQRGLNLIVGTFVLICAAWVTVNVIKTIAAIL